jgi:hypothetical protein
MIRFRRIWVLLTGVFLTHCMFGGSMKGVITPEGWLEFRGNEVAQIRPGKYPNMFYLNWNKSLAWARYDAAKGALDVESVGFAHTDGSVAEFFGTPWLVETPDFKKFLIYQGRGITFYEKQGRSQPDIQIIDVSYDPGEKWMLVDKEFTQAIVPLARSTKMDDDFYFGGTPLVFFRVDLVKGTFTTQAMKDYAASYMGPDFILWRHYNNSEGKGLPATPSHFTATDFNLAEVDHPFAKMMNRYKDSLPDFRNRFFISPMGWALMGGTSPITKTGIFLVNYDGKGHITPLLENGDIPIPDQSLDACAVSSDGAYFAFVTDYNMELFPSAKSAVVHLGKVEKVGEGFVIRITRLGDFADLNVGAPIWIPGTHALTIITNSIDHPSLIRIYDLDKHPIDWSKVLPATPPVPVKP